MIKRYTHHSLTWIDLESPTDSEIRNIVETNHIHPILAGELKHPSFRRRPMKEKGAFSFALHFPSPTKREGREIDFIITKDLLITARFGAFDAVHEFAKSFEISSMLNRFPIHTNASHLLGKLIETIYSSLYSELESSRRSIANIEDGIFAGEERQMVQSISILRRHLLFTREMLASHTDTLKAVSIAGSEIFSDSFESIADTLISAEARTADTLESLLATLSELQDTNRSLLSAKQNEQTKTLSVFAFITLPISILITLFQIDAYSRPLIGAKNDFWIFVVMLLTVGITLFGIFKWKKWL